MSKLTIHDWDTSKRVFEFVTYNRQHTACLVTDHTERRAVELWLPSAFDLQFHNETIPNSPPLEIRPAVLHLPSFLPLSREQAHVYPRLAARSKSASRREPFSLASVHPRKARTFRGHDPVKSRALDSVLQDEFVHHYGFDREQIELDCRAFCRWVQQDAIGDDLEHLARRNAPRVCYRVTFARQPACLCWLEGIEIRPLTPQENEDFNRLAETRSNAKSQPEPWHSDGFAVIFRRNARGESKTLSLVFRALCQILAEQKDQRAQFSKIELLLGERIRKLEKQDGQSDEQLSYGGWKQLREILKRPEAVRLQKWGVLRVEKSGRNRFLILSEPKLAK